MGIYDRDYYRKEGRSFLGSFTERGKICKWLIGANVVVFVLQILTTNFRANDIGPFASELLLDAKEVMGGEFWRLLTYAFLHEPFMLPHILFNMLFLWWFGSDVEDIYGPGEFLAFYLSAAFLSGLAFVAAWLLGVSTGVKCLGASGAVTAVLVLCALHFPDRPVYLFFLPIAIPIWIFVGFQVIQDSFIFASGRETGTAVTVHLGGALFGFLYYLFQWRILSLFGFLGAFQGRQRRRSSPNLRLYREQEAPVEAAEKHPNGSNMDEHLEAKMDAVLEKVARSGKESLTETEHQILLKASEMYKRKRN